jgi:hypothetical protein
MYSNRPLEDSTIAATGATANYNLDFPANKSKNMIKNVIVIVYSDT